MSNAFDRIKGGLKKTRESITGKLSGILAAFKKIDEDFYEELEETLILCDIGVSAADNIIGALGAQIRAVK